MKIIPALILLFACCVAVEAFGTYLHGVSVTAQPNHDLELQDVEELWFNFAEIVPEGQRLQFYFERDPTDDRVPIVLFRESAQGVLQGNQDDDVRMQVVNKWPDGEEYNINLPFNNELRNPDDVKFDNRMKLREYPDLHYHIGTIKLVAGKPFSVRMLLRSEDSQHLKMIVVHPEGKVLVSI